MGIRGTQIFNTISGYAKPEPDGSESETNLFAMFDSAIAALRKPLDSLTDTELDAVNKTSRGLSNALDNILTVRSELGTQMAELTKLDELGTERSLSQESQMKDLTGVNWSAAISDDLMQKDALQASYKVFSDLQGMSLFQMNR